MSLWDERDLVVLRALAANPPRDGILWVRRWSERPHPGLPSLTGAQVYDSLMVLHDAGYVAWGPSQGEGGGEWMFGDFQVTGAGKQVLGLWPQFDALSSPGELAALLEALADEAATEEERTNLTRAAGAVRRSAPEIIRSAVVGAVGALARSHLGI